MPVPSSVVLDDLSFEWPDGTPVLSHVDGALGSRRTGLVGANGAGKSTLLRLVAGQLRPTSGRVVVTGLVDHLPQDVTRGSRTTADLLGITEVRHALRAIEGGSVDPAWFDVVGDRWDVEERAVAGLASLGLPTDLDRPVPSLSGGEAVLVALAGVRLRGADVALLDEPTNNLDRAGREQVYDVVRGWRGTLVVVSHDVELLDLMDATVELRDSTLTSFGGGWSAFRAWTEAQQDNARQALRTAEEELRRQRRERAKAEERFAHSERKGRTDRANRTFVPAAIDARRNAAEKSQGSRRAAADGRVDRARAVVAEAGRAVRDDDLLRIDLPDPQVPSGRRVLELLDEGGSVRDLLVGPERVALVGRNGVGKTRMLARSLPAAPVPVGHLPQRLDLDDDATVLDLVRSAVPDLPLPELRNRLARLLVRGAMVERSVRTLSGGERLRVALARVVLADPPPDLLVLDEPTNDLDLDGVDQLVAALRAWRGALLVVSHDERFLERLGLDRVVRLG